MPSAPKIKIDIEHMDCAAWITTNNTYTGNPAQWDPEDLWQGVLFQFGDYMSMVGGTLDAFDGVELRKGNTLVLKISRAEFEADFTWINVVAKKDVAQTDPPMDATHLHRLLIDQTTNKPIRNYFTPIPGGMTFWHGKPGYSLVVKPAVDHPEHDRYTFSFKRQPGGYVTIRRGIGVVRYALGSKVSKIVVLFKHDPQQQHGNQNNPPQFP